MIWSTAHTTEYSRLATEMAEDAKWQLHLFTFGVTSAPVILTVLKGWLDSQIPSESLPVPAGWFFLAPLVVLVPTSFIILNRARTRNRKAAFIVTLMDPIRLADAGVGNHHRLQEVLRRGDLPWETALLFFERASPTSKRKTHFPPAVLTMLLSYFAIETVSWWLAYASVRTVIDAKTMVGMLLVAVLLLGSRTWWFWRLRSAQSIQAYVVKWLEKGPALGFPWPQYLLDWRDIYKGTERWTLREPEPPSSGAVEPTVPESVG